MHTCLAEGTHGTSRRPCMITGPNQSCYERGCEKGLRELGGSCVSAAKRRRPACHQASALYV